MTQTGTLADFFSAAPAKPAPSAGNTPWAATYAAEIRSIWLESAANHGRSLQRHLGPSELGGVCDREVVSKLIGLPVVNHVVDPWPSMRGTALHAHADEEVFTGYNERHAPRFLTERKVVPFDEHPGTADLYDVAIPGVVDHKFLGKSSLDKLRKNAPRKYKRQLLQYGVGYLRLGLPVRRVVILGYPATEASLNGIYVWEWEITTEESGWTELTSEAVAELGDTWTDTVRRKEQASEVEAGLTTIADVPRTPGPDCYFCGQYGAGGCPASAMTVESAD